MSHVGALVTDFRVSSMGMRDTLFLDKERLRSFLERIPDNAPVREMVAVCTCNRIELYYVCDDHVAASLWLTHFLARFHGVAPEHLERSLTNYRCAAAVRHLFRVAAGVESMVFGEHEILGQIRDAYFYCHERSSTDSFLNRLFQQAIATGKRVRGETVSGRGTLSMASVAAERVCKDLSAHGGGRVLVVGAGDMGLRAIKRLTKCPRIDVALSNRSAERAARIGTHFGIEQIAYAAWHGELKRFDAVLLATAASECILVPDDIRTNDSTRMRPLLIIDLGAPRNADPALGALDKVTLVCVDDLRKTAECHLEQRRCELGQVERIIEEEVQEFTRWYNYRSGVVCQEQ